MDNNIDQLNRRLLREKTARKQAEVILEEKALELYNANEQLRHLNENLEQQIRDKLAELRQSEQRYRQLIESVQDIIFKTSTDGHFTFVSPGIEQLLGYTEQEFLQMHFLTIIQPGYRQKLLDFYLLMLKNRQDSNYTEFPVVAKDGRIVWIGQTARLIESDEEVLELVAVARDISDRKKAETALQTTQTRLSTLITNLQSGVMVEDENRRVILVNQLFCDIFDIPTTPDELIGHDCGEAREQVKGLFVEPDAFIERMNELLQNRQTCVGEEICMLNGRILELDYIPILLDDKYMGQLWRYSDVTEKYQAREQIRRSEEKYRGIMNNMELGLLEVDNEQNIMRAYERCCNMLGYTEEELVGKNATELLVPLEFQNVIERQQRQREEGSAGSYELQLIRKDGSRIWVLVSGVPINDEHGVLVGSMGIHYDLSERKVLEEELAMAKQIAEEARQAEKQFLANMSHEIRTPLNAIIGMSHLLFDTQPSRQQREYIDILKTSADFLHSLISDLLDMTKIEAGRVEVHPRPFDLVGLLRATQKVFEMKLEGRPVDIDVMLDARITGDFIGDDVMLNQILMNLVGNADKFTEKGNIQITAKLKQDEETGCWIEFSVSDTGIGIPAEKLDLVFQKFKQVNPQGHKHKGTGLGLAITKELVDIQGGSISVKSQIGEGSVFTFTLPFAKSPVLIEAKAVVQSQTPSASSDVVLMRHVLVVEDNLMNQKYIGGLLSKWKIPYTLAMDGKRAVEEAKNQRFDMILMDIQMPIMDGYEATVAIRSTHNPNQHVPIIALTASAMLDHKNIAMEAGMNDFLTKPFDPGQLMALFKRYAPKVSADDSEPKALDQKRLQELYGTDKAYPLEMFDLFLTDVVPEIYGLQAICRAQDWSLLARKAHKLKPTLGMVGLSWLEEKMEELQKKLKQGAEKEIIEQYCTDIITGVNQMIPVLQKETQKLSQV
ncbi:PAS domain S-box protein [Spirosoma utsteinense]|uniref:histidine kinase n=1 Tax=Spirosoma utsteinense TaxID=2585773 RepID=A0ABR6WCP3_9BACT|nr:PAS domain S-box protein [Spirosoma utsteinense]MBC3794059.1 PAS domain S-box-containing protein [Spirosoma utsteinense]